MAYILNPKEEVVKVELTKHGKKMLGMGQFYPHYYAFFDNSIIYDTVYGGINNEDTNNIQDRILNKSLTFSSLNNTEDILKNKLGTSDNINNYAPAWSLSILKGEITYDISGSTYDNKIFDVTNIKYDIKLDQNTLEPVISGDYLLIDLQELNLVDELANFEIELITYDQLSGGKASNYGRKLYFYNKRTNVIDDILYEDDELPSKFFDISITDRDVNYYFDLLVDDEIDTELIVPTEKAISEKVSGTYSTSTPPTIIKKC